MSGGDYEQRLVDKDLAATVYLMVLDGYRNADIAERFNATAVPTIAGHKKWGKPGVTFVRQQVERREEFRHIKALARYRKAEEDWRLDYTDGGFKWTAEELQEATNVALDITYSVNTVRKRKSRALIQGEL